MRVEKLQRYLNLQLTLKFCRSRNLLLVWEKKRKNFLPLLSSPGTIIFIFFSHGFHQEYVMANSFLSTLMGNILNVDLGYSILCVTTF